MEMAHNIGEKGVFLHKVTNAMYFKHKTTEKEHALTEGRDNILQQTKHLQPT